MSKYLHVWFLDKTIPKIDFFENISSLFSPCLFSYQNLKISANYLASKFQLPVYVLAF